jgi:hypothetical protein
MELKPSAGSTHFLNSKNAGTQSGHEFELEAGSTHQLNSKECR